MTTLCLSINTTSFLPEARNSGRSQEAQHVSKLFEEIKTDFARSITIGNYYQRIEELINKAVREHLEENRVGALLDIINIYSYFNSLKFTKMLPSSIPIPNIYVETDGMVEFEWYINPKRLFSITIEDSNKLIYAGIFGDDINTYGTERFEQELPRKIFENIQRVYSRS
jgi:hypothetical protein